MSECIVRVPHRVDEVIKREYDIVPCSECRHSDEVLEGGMLECGKTRRRVSRDGYCPLGKRRAIR